MIGKRKTWSVSLLALLLFFFTAEQASSAETWQQVGPAEFSDGEARSVSMAMSGDGIPYVAFKDMANLGKGSLMKFDGLVWTYVGGAGFTGEDGEGNTEIGASVHLAFDSSGTVPYVAYQMPVSGIGAVKKFVGGAWENVGLAVSSGAANDIRIAIDGSNVPYVAYRDGAKTDKATVKKFLGVSWTVVGGSTGFTPTSVGYISLAIDSGGIPYIAYKDGSSEKANVMKLNGAAWVVVGNADFSPGYADYISLAIDGSGTPYVAYKDYSSPNWSYKASVMKLNGAAWEQVGNAEFTAGQEASYINLAIDGSGTPYVAYKEYINWSYKASVMKFNGAAWEQVGNADFIFGDAISLALSSSGIPYVAYQDYSSPNYSRKVSVAAFALAASAPWQQVGAAEFSDGEARSVSMAVSGDGIPYVAFKDMANLGKGSLMKFDGGAWTYVGGAGFTGEDGEGNTEIGASVHLAFDSSGTVPYVAYQMPVSGIGAVKKFVGGAWENVGLAVSSGAADGIRIALDGSNVPYVAYKDGSKGGKATVKKFSGVSWTVVGGSTGFTPTSVDYISLAIDSGGIPYIAYKDGSNWPYKANVMKLNGAAWVVVGNADFSPGYANYISLAIDGSGTPYVAYQDYSEPNSSYKASVMKLNGAAWEQVGNAEFTAGQADYISLAIDGSGMPYVAYSDGNDSWKASVMRFEGGAWTQVGNALFTAGRADYISLALNSSGIPYVAYWDYSSPNYSSKASVMKFVPNPCGTGRSLPANTWLMTAPSCQPAPFAWINSQHGDDLGNTYDTTWAFFKWASGAYVRQAGTDRLAQGIGNWSYSTAAGTLQLEGVATPTVDCTAYGLAGQCFAIDLPLPAAGQSAWALAGHPFSSPVAWADVKIAAKNGDGAWTAYSPSDAETAGYVRKIYQTYNGSSYTPYDDSTVGMIGTLQPQEAFWVRIMPGASGGLKLLIPVPAP